MSLIKSVYKELHNSLGQDLKAKWYLVHWSLQDGLLMAVPNLTQKGVS